MRSHYICSQNQQKKIEETYEFIRSSIEGLKNGSNLQLIILKKPSNEFIGCAGLHRINTKNPELGIWTKKELLK